MSELTVYAYNQGGMQVSTIPIVTPTAYHLAVKYHWFRKNIGIEFFIDKIESVKQKGDLFTKEGTLRV